MLMPRPLPRGSWKSSYSNLSFLILVFDFGLGPDLGFIDPTAPGKLCRILQLGRLRASPLFCERVLVLAVADRQRPLPALFSDDKFEPAHRRIDRDERNAPVVILARGHGALPFPKIKHRAPVRSRHIDIAQLLAVIFLRQLSHLIWSRRHDPPLPSLRYFRFVVRGRRFNFLLRLRL